MIPYKKVGVRFITAGFGKTISLSEKEYIFVVSYSVYKDILLMGNSLSRTNYPTFNIINHAGHNYRNASVLISGFYDAGNPNGYSELKEISLSGNIEQKILESSGYLNLNAVYAEVELFKRTSSFERTENQEGYNKSYQPDTRHTYSREYSSRWAPRENSYKSWAASRDKAQEQANMRESINKNKESKGENTMFKNLMKDVYFGRMRGKVAMSPYGMAIVTSKGSFAYDKTKEEFIDVSEMTFGGMDFFYAMPVAKDAVEVGDYIMHNDNVVLIVDINDRGNLVAIKVDAKEEVTIVATKNVFGFDFYTKVVNLAGNMFGEASEASPFGNMLPFLMMKDGGFGDGDNKMLMMMMMSQGGGFGGLDFASNPMMMYALMGDKGGDSDMLPFLLMANGGFGAKVASSKTAAATIKTE